MRRLHLFELEDQHWFPAFLRNYGTDYLRFIAHQFDIYKGVVPLIRKAIRHTPSHRIIDMASGGGGGWARLQEHLKDDFPELKITLTDYFPNVPAMTKASEESGGMIDHYDKPVDARQVPAELKGLRTQFLSFHHFRPADAQKIIQNAVDAGQPLAVFEVTERKFLSMVPILLSPLTVLAFTPFIRPFSIFRIIFTYLIPIVLPYVLWDGIVSVLRSYTLPELRGMVEKTKGWENYEWEIGRNSDGSGAVIYMVGWPKSEAVTRGKGELQ